MANVGALFTFVLCSTQDLLRLHFLVLELFYITDNIYHLFFYFLVCILILKLYVETFVVVERADMQFSTFVYC